MATQFPVVLGVGWDISHSVVVLRLARLVTALVTGAVLGVTLNRFIAARDQRPRSDLSRFATIVAMSASGLAPWIWLPLSPGYNDIVVIVVELVAAVLIRIAYPGLSTRTRSLLIAFLGPLTTVALLVKWPVGVVVAGVNLLVLLANSPNRRLTAWFPVAFGFSAIVVQVMLGSIREMVSGTRAASQELPVGYDMSSLLRVYREDVTGVLGDLISEHTLVTLVTVLVALVSAVAPNTRVVRTSFGILGSIAVLVLWERGTSSGNSARAFARSFSQLVMLALIALAVGALAGMAATWQTRSRTSPFAVVSGVALVLAPLMAAIGTGNPILYVAALACPLALSGLIVLAEVAGPITQPLVAGAAAFVATFGIAVAFTAADATWHRPYRQVELTDAETEIVAGPFAGLKVDRHLADNVNALNQVVDRVRPDFVIGYGKIPGVVAATGRPQPIYAWIPDDETWRADRSLEMACSGEATSMVLVPDDFAPTGVCESGSWLREDLIVTIDGRRFEVWIVETPAPAGTPEQ